jgi:hypothetical protein
LAPPSRASWLNICNTWRSGKYTNQALMAWSVAAASSKRCGLRATPTPPGVPEKDDIAGKSRQTRWQAREQLFNREDELRGPRPLRGLAIDQASHLDDIVLVVPVFLDETLLGWAGSLAHHLDLGAGSPGINPKAREVFDEGLRIPPMRITLDDLAPGGELATLIEGNIRVPQQTLGDIRAQIAAVCTGERRLRALAERHGVSALHAAMEGLLDYAETMTRGAIRAIPDGRYTGEEWMDDNGPDGERCGVPRYPRAATPWAAAGYVRLT